MRDINWGISFDITINGIEARFSDLTELEQKKILDDLADDYYKDDFVWWINNVAIPKLEVGVKEGRKKFWFGSENGFYTCEADDRDSGGYLYCGFYSTKEYDEMIKE